MSIVNKDGFTAHIYEPSKYDDFLVKTFEGTYEFAHFNKEGWSIRGDNKGFDG